MSVTMPRETIDTSHSGNRLIDNLPGEQRTAVLAQCERIEAAPGTVLCEAGEPFSHAYFPVTGTISLVMVLEDHAPFETRGIGSEGMLGATLVLEINRADQRGIVLTPCQALRMEAGSVQAAVRSHPGLLSGLQHYLYVAYQELSLSTGCIRFHEAGKRLARGLLMAQDRAHSDKLPMTHQMLADMLGVQRGAVTIAAIELQKQGLIRYSRGKITILDRAGLEAASCCYRASTENHTGMLY